jgi:hypothetical protein
MIKENLSATTGSRAYRTTALTLLSAGSSPGRPGMLSLCYGPG